ncbi:MAG: SpoIIE family protein phosphatase [Oscillospiraceae bacterium]|jgi:stage II sporulation protein E|nr:SpoIIE family protein phosphatase [Oscillospiraceae bacterium]
MAEWIAQLRDKSATRVKVPWFTRAPISSARTARLAALAVDTLAGLLLSQASFFEGGMPFAVAWMAARLLWDRWPLGTLIGVALGFVIRWEPISWMNGWQMAACALLLITKGLQPHIALPAPWAMALMAGLFALIPAPFLWRSQAQVVSCMICAASTAIMTPVFDRVAASFKQRAYLESDDRLCCLVALAAMCLGGAALTVGGFHVGGMLAVYCVLSLAWTAEAGAAIVAGVALGVALTLGGMSPFCMIALAMIALAASLLRDTKRVWLAVAAMAANALVALTISSARETLFAFPHVLAGAAAFLITPAPVWVTIRASLERETTTQTTPSGVAIQWIQTSANAIASMARSIPHPDLTEDGEIEQLAALLCENCVQRGVCWNERFEDTTLTLSDLLAASRDESMQPRELIHLAKSHGCQRFDFIPDTLKQVNRAKNRLSSFEAAQMQASRLAKTQLQGQVALLNQLSTLLAQAAAVEPSERLAISRALSKTRWRVCTAMPYRLDDLLQIVLIPPEKADLGEPPLTALSRALAMPLVSKPLWDGLVYVSQRPALSVVAGIATCPAHGQLENGDGWRSQPLPRARHMLALSDGMGHGSDAAKESHTVLSLLTEGFQAGYGRKELLSMVNDLVRTTHSQERYATLDLCVLDLKTGDAAFEKMGACASFLIRQDRCRKLSGGTLPMGILEDVTPKSFRMKLIAGDLLVMVSDGIVDSFEQEDAMLAVMARLSQEPPSFANELLRAALQRMGDEARDDMTVLAARLSAEMFTE